MEEREEERRAQASARLLIEERLCSSSSSRGGGGEVIGNRDKSKSFVDTLLLSCGLYCVRLRVSAIGSDTRRRRLWRSSKVVFDIFQNAKVCKVRFFSL